ncbi:putative purine nucleoside phosphorylase [Desulforapulum autotrophicum HRM2]|uniref:Purine nucleoside phosphorylase n=1 Tax=Desulforapulum autotrophicum (strain ATCC 43914 / DSM 3382 / VKM B-1955 / HRM2) TaxID=177437 RepID=C0QJ87_DESAH|nr:nucleoside phosphorylase [Desulforapulum autotrophicum]ACN15900.1 putative purine nucleoside phosphorylase [Desulforapulum autotrophicum HRM2]
MSFPTWSDLNDRAIIQPYGARPGFESGAVAVMVSTAPDFNYLKANARGNTCSPLFMGSVFTETEKGASFTGPHMGAPYATMVEEALIAKGARTLLVFGWCGSLSTDLAIGDIVLVDGAIADEGTSRNYMEPGEDFPRILPDSDLRARLGNELSAGGIAFKSGTLWTTDGIYRETPKKVEFFRNRGAAGVDMECSALFAVGRYRKVRMAAILVVSDELGTMTWKPGFKSKSFKAARKQVADLLLDLSRRDFCLPDLSRA